MSDTDTNEDGIEDSAAPLIEHLAELRTRLIRAVMAFIVGIVIAFVVAEPILQFLLEPIEATLRELGDPSPTMQYTSPQEYLFTLFRISMVFGFVLAFPVIGYQLWRFVAPGLYSKEKGAFLPFLIASPLMFLLGASFAHFVVTPLAMAFFLGFADVPSLIADLMRSVTGDLPENVPEAAPVAEGIRITFFGKVNESLDITLKFIMAFGMCFQLPVLLTLMGKAGLVSAEGLRNVRKYAVVGILLLAALVTPPDIITQVILFVVVYGLYEISIFLVTRVEKKREAKLRAEGLWFEDEEEGEDIDENDEANT
ncbi:sec-independent protein translocase protein TatC [Octadecabacter temperatus]|uniref:Sec-independent protein translocase protein TatC n=1 Tax=Octadecabacter temperatus TaxID=1458307 RepID=A0A0K0Y6Q2_9RHOB|nr:twin-arginine translocase subunit TatC [Octadecabacter temperatus]AKS46576.1 Sec-independent protein translocase protein TatC [Octadecabacter temperatus]SIO16971.1 sec-independent protein translocase protein TatC [Octadecabacter temperatus]